MFNTKVDIESLHKLLQDIGLYSPQNQHPQKYLWDSKLKAGVLLAKKMLCALGIIPVCINKGSCAVAVVLYILLKIFYYCNFCILSVLFYCYPEFNFFVWWLTKVFIN